MKIAIIGTGIAGNTAAWRLRDRHEITVFEADDRIGGHTHTIDVPASNGPLGIDTGFIVFNDRTYPEFSRMLQAIGQEWQASTMSFSVQSAIDGLEYNGASLNSLFAQRRNLLRPKFWRMVRDILRFNREAPVAVEQESAAAATLGDYLRQHGYSDGFRDHYLVPMAAAIWSADPANVLQMPLQFLLRFFRNHGLLQLDDRPNWRTIRGGSRHYVDKLVAGHRDRIRLGCPVRALRRRPEGVYLTARGCGEERYDGVFIACHSDQALRLLSDATTLEREVLGAIPYQRNDAVLHTDRRLLPVRSRARAAWNYHIPADPRAPVAVTYNMNVLQSLSGSVQYCVTLNNADAVQPDRVLKRITYEHPLFSQATVKAQARHREINSADRTFFCGAYWGNGFHEDGVVSALRAIRHFEEAELHGKLHFRRAG